MHINMEIFVFMRNQNFNRNKIFKILLFTLCSLCLVFQSGGQILNLPELVKQIDPTVLKLYTIGLDGQKQSQASAVILSSNGLCITNFHVLAGSRSAYVIDSKNQSHKIEGIVEYSQEKDLVVFKIGRGAQIFPFAKTKTTPIDKGATVFAIGYPNGFAMEGGSTVSTGIISGFRNVDGTSYLQTTTPITHGSSGGGLFDQNGNLVGVTTGTFASVTEDLHANMNKCVPATEISKLKRNLNLSFDQFYNEISFTSDFIQGLAYYIVQDYETAAPYFIKHLETYSGDMVAWMKLGICLNQIAWSQANSLSREAYDEKLNLSVFCFRNAAALDSTYYPAFGQAMLSYMTLGEMDQAQGFASWTLKLAPKESFANYIQGRYYSEVGNYENSIYYLSKSIEYYDEEDIDLKKIYLERSIAYVALKNYPKALADLMASLNIDDLYQDAIFHYAVVLSESGEYEEGCKYIYKLKSLNENYMYSDIPLNEVIRKMCTLRGIDKDSRGLINKKAELSIAKDITGLEVKNNSESNNTSLGQVVFWTDSDKDGEIRVYVDSKQIGVVRNFVTSGIPNCNVEENIALVESLKDGVYNYYAKGKRRYWLGTLTIREGSCTIIRLSYQEGKF